MCALLRSGKSRANFKIGGREMTSTLSDVHERLAIGGGWVTPSDGRLVPVVDPYTEEPFAHAALGGPADLDRAVRAARASFDSGVWSEATPQQRAAVLTRAGELRPPRPLPSPPRFTA